MTVLGIHHITILCADLERMTRFYRDLLGLRLVKRTVNYDEPRTKHFYFGDATGSPGTVLTFFEYPGLAPGKLGAGSTHHFALMVEDEAEQLAWRERLQRAGVVVTPVQDRTYFKSIYFRDPDGHIVEIATRGPGFAVDEPVDRLGEGFILPGWLPPQEAEGFQAALRAEERLSADLATTNQVVIWRYTGGAAVTNAYLVADLTAGEALAIDAPEGAAAALLARAQELGVQISAIVNTHGHWDHIVDNVALQRSTGAALLAHEADVPLLAAPRRSNGPLPASLVPSTPDRLIGEGDRLTMGQLEFSILHTPGHSPGSICLLEERHGLLIDGDVIFANAHGRVDVLGADAEVLARTLARLARLPAGTEVFPGHGRPTSIGRELFWMRKLAKED